MSSNYRRVPSTEMAQSQQAAAAAASAGATSAAMDSSSSSNHQNAATATTATSPPSSPPRWEQHSGGNSVSNASTTTANATSDRLADKAIALIWVIAAILVAWWSKTATVVLSPTTSGANRFLLCLVAVLLGINTILVLYLTVYLPRIKGLTDSSAWNVYCPAVIPSMTLTGIASFLLAIRATWPVWGFLAPLVLGMQCLGLLFSLHFVPWF